jgi:DNA-binding response OmpR family regulator
MKICVLDDNVRLAKSIEKFFAKEWHDLDLYHTRAKFMQTRNFSYDVFIIDIGLQDGNWLDIARYLRNIEQTESPILVISWYQWLDTKLEWFEIGIDDYIVKPFSPLELNARIKSILKKVWGINSWCDSYDYQDICFDRVHRRVLLEWAEVEFSKKEKQILEYFLAHQWVFIAKNQLIQAVRGADIDTEKVKNALNVSICKIRKKLWEKFHLSTINSEWYILEVSELKK